MLSNENNKSSPIVSVCIVTYNHELYIRDCILSAISQAHDISIEILVGIDASADNTLHIVKDLAELYPQLIRIFFHENRLGSGSKNYQFLIQHAKGQFIAHLDGDDYWLPGKLNDQVNFLTKHPDCPAVYTNALAIQDSGRPFGLFTTGHSEKISLSKLIRHGNFLNHSSILYRADLRKDLLKFHTPFLDYRIHLSHSLHGDLGFINSAYVCYRVQSKNSVLMKENERTRRLYWESLIEFSRHNVSYWDISIGLAEFARSIFFRSIRIKNPMFFVKWIPTIIASHPSPQIIFLLLFAISIFRTMFFHGITALLRFLNIAFFRVLYP